MVSKTDCIHPTFHETTCHASITCMCGKKVWYGVVEPSRKPKYCYDCEQKILLRVHPPKSQQTLTI